MPGFPSLYAGHEGPHTLPPNPIDPEVEDIVALLGTSKRHRKGRAAELSALRVRSRSCSGGYFASPRRIETWLTARQELPFGAIFCILSGPTAGQSLSDTDARRQLRDAAKRAGLRRRAHPHCSGTAHAVEVWREKIDVYTIQQQFGHARLDVTANYLRGVGAMEILELEEEYGPVRPPDGEG